MAKAYPHAQFVGVDLAPVPLDATKYPRNVRFEIDNVDQGLAHFYGQFDLVNGRCIMTGLRDPVKTFREMQLCLRPGGLLLLIAGDIRLIDESDGNCVKMAKLEGDEDVNGVNEHGSWFQRILWGK